jgi:demethylmenaquinone methyltransferase/2-methoxy-6-polyprenyl-1,4-benzoquinol methylase
MTGALGPLLARERGGAPTPGAPEKDAVRSMFDRIAPRYDLLNRLLSAGIDVRWRRACVDDLRLEGPALVLDLCTGTADLLLETLSRETAGRGVGVDLSREMLERGAAKLRRRGLAPRSNLLVADVERLPLREGTFDAAMVAFGIRNVSDPDEVIREVHRILKPKGVFVVLEFSLPPGLLGRLYGFYFERILPRIGGLVSGDPEAYSYLPASVGRFPSPEHFEISLRRAGFRVGRRRLSGGIAYLYRGEKTH